MSGEWRPSKLITAARKLAEHRGHCLGVFKHVDTNRWEAVCQYCGRKQTLDTVHLLPNPYPGKEGGVLNHTGETLTYICRGSFK